MAGTVEVIAHGLDIIYESCTGNVNIDTIFKLASVGKQITSILVLSLVTTGEISLKDKIRDIIPSLAYSKSTIFNLLSHTSDIPDIYQNDFKDEDKVLTNEDLLSYFMDEFHTRGTIGEYNYNNTNYDLLYIIVERVCDCDFEDILRKRVLGRLDMNRTFTADDEGGEVISYSSKTGERYECEIYNCESLNRIVGSGGIYSCANDLVKWNFFMKYLIPSELWDLIQVQITPGYSLGFEVSDQGYIFHSGSWEGFNTYLAYYPEDDLSVIVLSNIDTVDAEAIGRGLLSRN